MRRWALRLFGLGFFLLLGAYFALPSPWRVLTPPLFGQVKIAKNIYVDDVAEASRILPMIAAADAVAERFFGPIGTAPRWVICTGDSCQARFGVQSLGLALGKSAVLIMPDGVNATIITHERAHIALHSYMGLSDVIDPRFPAWFDEGLASLLGQDDRHTVLAPIDAAWVMEAQSFRDWGAMVRLHGWPDTYGAAMSLVADLDRRLGRKGLQAFVRQVGTGQDFEELLEQAVGQDWP